MEADEEHRRPLTAGSRTPQPDKNDGVPAGQRSSTATPEPAVVPSHVPASPAPGPEVLLMRPDSAKASPPALPPRPRVPQRPASMATSSGARCRGGGGRGLCWRGGGLRKYVFLCAACGGMSSLLGILFLAVYFMLRSYTSSLVYFETVPTYVPASMLLSTGLVVMCLARRRNRYSFLMKLCGCACLASAALCVLVTVATTVVHMSRLQSLSQCHYQQRTQTCTCYSALIDASATDSSDEGARYVFNAIPDCDVIHGALYSCLRAMFGLSVVGILVCIFSGMLVYQLFSHEKKKMYWEQLELRCRYLYRRQQSAQQALQQHVTHHCGSCSCCEDCRDLQTPPPSVPWEFMDNRYWAPGRVGNLYSPNPEDHAAPALRGAPRGGAAPNPGSGSAWSWRRLPWGRSTAVGGGSRVAGEVLCIRPQNAASPDSQYGFSGSECGRGLSQLGAHLGSHLGRDPTVGPYLLSQVYPAPQPHPRPFAPVPPADSMGMPLPLAVPMPLSLADDLGPQFYLWGPPPPYMSNPASAANSPARRDPGVSPSPASPGCNLTNNYQQLLRANQRPTHRCGVGSATPAGPAGPVGPTTMTPDTLDRPLSPGEDPGNNSVDSLSSPEKTVPRKKRRKAAADGSADPSLEAEAPRPELDSPESPTPTAQAALPGPTAARKAKKRSDAPAPPGSRPNSRPSSRHSSRYSHRARAHGDTCCGDASDDVDTEGYSYPRLRFPPPQPPTTPPSSPPTSDSQAILAAFDNQAFQEAASDCPGSPGGVPLQGPVKTLTLGPQGPLVCKKRSADPNESEVYFGDDSSCCNVSEQHSSLTYEDPGRELRAFKLVHSHVQQRSMDSTPTRPVSVHRPSASTLSDSAVPDPASRLPPYHLHPIETTATSFGSQARQRMPLPLPANSPDRLSLAPDAQYESIADSNVYTYISPLPLVHQVARTVSRTTSSPLGSPSGSSAPPQARRKAACDSPHKAVESADDKENATNTQREATETAAARAGAGPVSAPSPSQRPLCPPDERPGIDV